jgi:hypothetical protein
MEIAHTVVGFLCLKNRRSVAIESGKIRQVVAVQKGRVGSIKISFYSLKVVALQIRLDDMHAIIGKAHPFVRRKQRHFFPRPHIRENDARHFSTRISRVTDLFLEVAIGGLGGRIQDVTFDVVFPAMIDAP